MFLYHMQCSLYHNNIGGEFRIAFHYVGSLGPLLVMSLTWGPSDRIGTGIQCEIEIKVFYFQIATALL